MEWGGRRREKPRERSPRRRGGDARPAHAPQPSHHRQRHTAPGASSHHHHHTRHASHTPLGLASPLLRGGRPRPLHRQSTARIPPSPPGTRRKGGGEGPDPTPDATRFATPHAPHHNPRRLPEPPSTTPAREGRGGRTHPRSLSALLAPPGTGQAGHGQPAKARSLSLMILPQVHLRKPCYDFYFL